MQHSANFAAGKRALKMFGRNAVQDIKSTWRIDGIAGKRGCFAKRG